MQKITSWSGETADSDFIRCAAAVGVRLPPSQKWVEGEPVEFVFVPAGIHTIDAGFRHDETITCTVEIDAETAEDLQTSFDELCADHDGQEPFSDEDHESKKATLRFPAGQVRFTFGSLKGHEGVICEGAEPTSYGAEVVNGKVYRSWSPEFATDADIPKARCKAGHWTFPDGVRGSESNPARIIAVNFVTGALTNKPAFTSMPPIKAKKADLKPTLQEQARHDIGVRTAAVIFDRLTVQRIADRVVSTRLANQVRK